MPDRETPAAHHPRTATRRIWTVYCLPGDVARNAPAIPGEPAMRKLVVSAAVATFLATGSMAFAAVHHTTGNIKTFDAAAKSLVLQDGTTFQLAKTFKDPGLKVGEKVTVSWDMSGKNKVAESAMAAK
jgi:ferric-dicitrate binding protein FerR (iron transport regulator)